MDEPTSGLDAFTAHHLVETLRNLSDSGRTVIMSIHQPRSDIFELFGQVMLLSTGCVVYHGEAKYMIGYFTDLGYPCPELTNPCDYYVDLVTVDMQSIESELDSFQRIQTLVDKYNDMKASFFNAPQPSDVTSDLAEPQIAIFSAQTSYWTQFSVLIRRAFKNNILDYGLFGIQAVQALMMSLMVGLVYYDLQLEQKDIRDHFSMMFIVSALYPYLVILDVIGKYHAERKTLFYEMMDGLYSFGPYFFAKILCEVPEHTIFVTLYCLPLYFLSGQQVKVTVIFKFMATVFTVVYCSRALSLWASATMPTFQLSVLLAQMIYTFCLLTCGYIINLDSIFIGLKWFENFSFLKWCYQAMCDIHIKGLEFSCNDTSKSPCIRDGQEAFEIYSIDDDPLYIPLLVMAGEVVFLMLLFYSCGRLVKQRPYEA